MSLVKQILEQRATVWEEGKALLDKAEAEGRSLTAEESQTWDRINAELTGLDDQRKSIEDAERRSREAEEAMRDLGAGPERRAAVGDDDRRLAADVRSFLRGDRKSAEIRDADADWIDFEALRANTRALSVGSATAGGNTVPKSFRERLYEHAIEMSAVMNLGCEILNTQSGETFEMPITTAHGTATLTPEGSQITGTDPAFGKRSLGAFKYGQVVYISRELVEDEKVDILGYIARQGGWAVGNALGAHLIAGDGSSKPAGVSGSTTLGVTGGTGVGGAPTFDNLIDLYYSVIAPYRNRPSAGWCMNDLSVAAIRKIKDTTGQYIWQPSLIPGSPDVILGKPVRTDPNMPTIGTTKKSVIFGAWDAYTVRLVRGVRFERSDDFKFDTDQIAFKVVIRGDGVLVDQTGALKHYVGAAS